MKTIVQSWICPFLLPVLLSFCGVARVFGNIQEFGDARLINHASNDGDSFVVEAGTKSFHIRLYYVDCPETEIGMLTDARRVREQARYFGLLDAVRVIHFGNEAKLFVEKVLAEPFTVHTAFAQALGRSKEGRVYAFVTTSNGEDLGKLLVKNGFARTHGVGRKTPDGISRDAMFDRLRDFEISAMLKRAGIWSESDPERIAELREQQRSEEQELKRLQNDVRKTPSQSPLLNPNTADKEELQTVRGIGLVLAERIIAGRPYESVEDLIKVKGISQKRLENLRTRFIIEGEQK